MGGLRSAGLCALCAAAFGAACSLATSFDGYAGARDAGDDAASKPSDAAIATSDAAKPAVEAGADADTKDGGLGAYASAVMSDGPIAYYRFGEQTGTTANDATGHRPGTYDMGTTLGAPGALRSDPDTAATFDGMIGNVDVGDAFEFIGVAAMSVEVWVKPSVVDNGVRWIANRNPATGTKKIGWSLYHHTGIVGFERADENTTAGTEGVYWHVSLPTTSFTHLVVTCDGTMMTIYANGDIAAQAQMSIAVAHTAGDFQWGAPSFNTNTTNRYGGVIDEAAIYDKALTQDRIRAHYMAAQ